jgi:transcriptional regulator with XRE-family HTH domain
MLNAVGQPVEMPAAGAGGADPVEAGRTLRALREAHGLSQSELARRSATPRTHLIAVEQGRHEPSLNLLTRLAGALGCEVRDLIWSLVGEPFADAAASLAVRLRLRRERLGLTAAELAARAATTRATISQIEGGVNANPSLGLLARLAAALQCCPSELVPPLPHRGQPGRHGARGRSAGAAKGESRRADAGRGAPAASTANGRPRSANQRA